MKILKNKPKILIKLNCFTFKVFENSVRRTYTEKIRLLKVLSVIKRQFSSKFQFSTTFHQSLSHQSLRNIPCEWKTSQSPNISTATTAKKSTSQNKIPFTCKFSTYNEISETHWLEISHAWIFPVLKYTSLQFPD